MIRVRSTRFRWSLSALALLAWLLGTSPATQADPYEDCVSVYADGWYDAVWVEGTVTTEVDWWWCYHEYGVYPEGELWAEVKISGPGGSSTNWDTAWPDPWNPYVTAWTVVYPGSFWGNYTVDGRGQVGEGPIIDAWPPALVWVEPPPQPACAIPTNFRQVAAGIGAVVLANEHFVPPGEIGFVYLWDSSTGNYSDLSDCAVFEFVVYPGPLGDPPVPVEWPHPFPIVQPTQWNPTVNSHSGNLPNGIADIHQTPGTFRTPYETQSFVAEQSEWTQRIGGGLDDPGTYRLRISLDSAVFQTASGTALSPPASSVLDVSVSPHDRDRLRTVCERLADRVIAGRASQIWRNAVVGLTQIDHPVAVPSLRRVVEATHVADSEIAGALVRIGTDEARVVLWEMRSTNSLSRFRIADEALRRFTLRNDR